MPNNNNNPHQSAINLKQDSTNFELKGEKGIQLDQVEAMIQNALQDAKDTLAKQMQDAKDDFTKQVQMDKIGTISTFGIFASMITFLTIEFQLLRTVYSIQKHIGLSLILLASLFGFNIALDYLVKSRVDKEAPRPNAIFCYGTFTLFIVGIIMACFGKEETYRENQIHLKYASALDDHVFALHKQYAQKIQDLQETVKELKNSKCE